MWLKQLVKQGNEIHWSERNNVWSYRIIGHLCRDSVLRTTQPWCIGGPKPQWVGPSGDLGTHGTIGPSDPHWPALANPFWVIHHLQQSSFWHLQGCRDKARPSSPCLGIASLRHSGQSCQKNWTCRTFRPPVRHYHFLAVKLKRCVFGTPSSVVWLKSQTTGPNVQ